MTAGRPVTAGELMSMGEGRRELILEERGYLAFAPDLAVEVVSPSDSFTEVESKARMWLEHGSRTVWVVEPDSRRVLIHEPGRDRREIGEGETLEGGEVLPGFDVRVAKLFGD